MSPHISDSAKTRALAAEMFFTAVGPALVRRVSSVLDPLGIPVMPLKGVLLQQLVYGKTHFRSISDVDLLVPDSRFDEAWRVLSTAGFSRMRWEKGGWQVAMRDPEGPPLGVDLHRRLTRTTRSRLMPDEFFERGHRDEDLFGAPVTLPDANDLFAHLIQHAALHWISRAELHHPEDFRAMSESPAAGLEVRTCAGHLQQHGLAIHALVVLPLVQARYGCAFLQEIVRLLQASRKASLTARWIAAACVRYRPDDVRRRIAGVALSPSLAAALSSAALDRLAQLRQR